MTCNHGTGLGNQWIGKWVGVCDKHKEMEYGDVHCTKGEKFLKHRLAVLGPRMARSSTNKVGTS